MKTMQMWAISSLQRNGFQKCAVTVCFRRIRVGARGNRNKIFADTNKSGYVWTGPQTTSHLLALLCDYTTPFKVTVTQAKCDISNSLRIS